MQRHKLKSRKVYIRTYLFKKIKYSVVLETNAKFQNNKKKNEKKRKENKKNLGLKTIAANK